MDTLSLLVPVGILMALGAFVAFLVRGGAEALSLRNVLRAYLRLAYLVSLGVLLVGATMTITVALASAFGHAFSYADLSQEYGVTPFCPPGLAEKCAAVPSPPPDTRQQEDLIRGLTLLLAGAALAAAHKAAQFTLETKSERRYSALARAEALLGTGILGLVSIIAIPLAASAVIRYKVIGEQASLFNGPPSAPGGTLAMALVFLPAWLAYLCGTFRRIRSNPNHAGDAPLTPAAV